MRGIVFTGGAGQGSDFLRSIAKEADLIIAADSGLAAVENAGICPEWIIGDMDSLDDPRRLEKYAPEAVLRCPRDKDYTDTELALNKLWEEGCDEVWISGGGGGRTDHLLAIYSLFQRERAPSRWITGTEDMLCLDSGGEITRRVNRNSTVSVFPLGDGPWEAQSSGLKWPLNGLEWKRGDSFGISNSAETEEFRIRSIRGRFMIILPFGESNGNNN